MMKYIIVCDNTMLVNTSFDILQINVSDNKIMAYLINYLILKQEKVYYGDLQPFHDTLPPLTCV